MYNSNISILCSNNFRKQLLTITPLSDILPLIDFTLSLIDDLYLCQYISVPNVCFCPILPWCFLYTHSILMLPVYTFYPDASCIPILPWCFLYTPILPWCFLYTHSTLMLPVYTFYPDASCIHILPWCFLYTPILPWCFLYTHSTLMLPVYTHSMMILGIPIIAYQNIHTFSISKYPDHTFAYFQK